MYSIVITMGLITTIGYVLYKYEPSGIHKKRK